ncbi:MAG: hypothetical protein JSU04_02535 [Bdellovibrionales bacterium]|nr:hypothetical protein [Bdellovibrionales bacterium]
MKSFLKNQRGYVGAMLVIAIAVIVGIMIVGITHKMGDLTKTYDKSRAFFDSEIAIEKFSVSLKNAYDRANYLQDLRPQTAGSPATDDYGCPGKITTIGAGTAAPIRLCWEFNNLCTKRAAGTSLDICIDQSNLQVRMKTPNEWEVALEPTPLSNDEKWALFKEASVAFMKDWAIPEAKANLETFMPGLPAASSVNSIVMNMGVRSRPEAPDCTPGAANPFQCLKVSFCVKNGGACAANELIRQTYLFSKPAATTQGW